MAEKTSVNKLFRDLQDKGYKAPFADFANWYNKNQHVADKGFESVYGALLGDKMDAGVTNEDKKQFTDENKPKTLIFGLPPVAAGIIGVIVIGSVIAGGIYLFSGKENKG